MTLDAVAPRREKLYYRSSISKKTRNGRDVGDKEGDVLRMVVVRSSKGAKQYYGTSDYYSEGVELAGEWGGEGSARLGLSGHVDRTEFGRMCDNRHPLSGERFTLRTNAERRVAYDLNWHVPKSVSVVFSLTQSPEILAAFRAAVGETMRELEARVQTRVRVHGANDLRSTGNLTWATFIHTTARPVDGVPDPHLHCHAVVFNATFDAVEARWKAIDLSQIKRVAPYFEAAFHARLAGCLRRLGYDVVRTAKGWELAGVPARVLEEFSRRTALVEKVAAERGIVDDHVKDSLGAQTRERKATKLSLSKLRAMWAARLSSDELRALSMVAAKALKLPEINPGAGRDALEYAAGHCFERASVVSVDRLLAVALRHGVGEVDVEKVRKTFEGMGLLVRDQDGISHVTAREVLLEEGRMLAFARDGRGTCAPLVADVLQPARGRLSQEQHAAVSHILGSRDRVVLLRGAAGVGKTTLMTEAVRAIERGGKTVVALAPSAAASRGVLRSEGFDGADTVARFLFDSSLQERARGQVLWVDEAGLLGTGTLGALFSAAARLAARVVLVGDSKQHASVERGTALKLLEREAGLPGCAITNIRRQTGRYRDAVKLLSEGRTADGFDVLAELGWVREAHGDEGEKLIAAEYLRALRDKKTALVVSPTHAEGERVTRAIRAALLDAGILHGEVRHFSRLIAIDLTLAQRGDGSSYECGQVIQFHQHAPKFRSGSRWVVVRTTGSAVMAVDASGQRAKLPLTHAARFQVFRAEAISLRAGDRIRITRNGKSKDGERKLDNGTLAVVKRFTPAGDVELESGAVLAADWGHLAHGYCITSHASQGKTVDRVLIAQGAESFVASSREQLYVSVSRGRESALIVTDDKHGLRAAAAQSDPRPTATELFGRPAGTLWRPWLERRVERVVQMVWGSRNEPARSLSP